MAKLLRSMKCFFTGGHEYSDENLRVMTDEPHDVASFTNYCTKCGKSYEVVLPYGVVMSTCLIDVYKEARYNAAVNEVHTLVSDWKPVDANLEYIKKKYF